jgi:hypothetical protein
MKKHLLALSLSLILLAMLPWYAMANQWGISGELYTAVSDAGDTWDAYSVMEQASGTLAIMKSKYHHVLMCLMDDGLHTYTKAVYQPGETDAEVALEAAGDGFTLSYGTDETYSFCPAEEGYMLEQARVGDLILTGCRDEETGDIYRYEAVQGSESATWYASQHLGEFNIALFPRSVAEIRRLNLLGGALASGDSLFPRLDGDTPALRRFSGVGAGTEAVYSAPYEESAWRAADGKAAVGLAGELWYLRSYYDTLTGKAYACIRYAVSQRTHRIGYIRGTTLDPDADTAWAETDSVWAPYDQLLSVPLRAVSDTYLTDDPDVSQYPQFAVPAGTLFDCMALYGESYAYVGAEVRDGQFVDGGAIVWGFVPLRALEPLFAQEAPQSIRDSLVGTWSISAGGSMIPDPITFYANGTYQTPYGQGTWIVRVYNPGCNLYWNNPPYELWLTDTDTGMVTVRGLSFQQGGFSLSNSEGSGGYEPTTELPGSNG